MSEDGEGRDFATEEAEAVAQSALAGEVLTEIELEPVGKPASLWGDAWKELRTSPIFIISALLILVFIVMAITPSLFTDADPRACNLRDSLERPSAGHWFGFDLQGCDYYARTVYGAQVSISIGIIVTVFAVIIAVILGSLAGYYGGFLDTIIARMLMLHQAKAGVFSMAS